jgi:hypothetical protein
MRSRGSGAARQARPRLIRENLSRERADHFRLTQTSNQELLPRKSQYASELGRIGARNRARNRVQRKCAICLDRYSVALVLQSGSLFDERLLGSCSFGAPAAGTVIPWTQFNESPPRATLADAIKRGPVKPRRFN